MNGNNNTNNNNNDEVPTITTTEPHLQIPLPMNLDLQPGENYSSSRLSKSSSSGNNVGEEGNHQHEYIAMTNREGDQFLGTKSTMSLDTYCNYEKHENEDDGNTTDPDNDNYGNINNEAINDQQNGVSAINSYPMYGYNEQSGLGSFQPSNTILNEYNEMGSNQFMQQTFNSQDGQQPQIPQYDFTGYNTYQQQQQQMYYQKSSLGDLMGPMNFVNPPIIGTLSPTINNQYPQMMPVEPQTFQPQPLTAPSPTLSPTLMSSSSTNKRKRNVKHEPKSPVAKKARNAEGLNANEAGEDEANEEDDGCTCRIEKYKGIVGLGDRQTTRALNDIWFRVKQIREFLKGHLENQDFITTKQSIEQLRADACRIETQALLHPLELDAIDVICTACDVALAEWTVIQNQHFNKFVVATAIIVGQPYHRLIKQKTNQANSNLGFVVRIVAPGDASNITIDSLNYTTFSSSSTTRTAASKSENTFGVHDPSVYCKKHNCYALTCSADNGTRKLPVSFSVKMKVHVTVPEIVPSTFELSVETQKSNKFVVFTNECQFDDGNTELFKSICFENDRSELTWHAFANIIQRHYVMSLRRDLINIERYLSACELEYLHSTFLGNAERFTEKDISDFWHWYVRVLHQLRHGKGIPELWLSGAIWGFVSKDNITKVINNSPIGTFALRFSESNPGLFSACVKRSNEMPVHKLYSDKIITQTVSLADVICNKASFRSVIKVKYNDLDNDGNPSQPITEIHNASMVFKKYCSKQKTDIKTNGYECD